MKFKEKLKDTFCIVGKSTRNKLPHIISCSVGIENLDMAKRYSKQMSKMRDGRKSMYEWTKPMVISEAFGNKNILVAPIDLYYMDQEVPVPLP
jgi:hypothetical protein